MGRSRFGVKKKKRVRDNVTAFCWAFDYSNRQAWRRTHKEDTPHPLPAISTATTLKMSMLTFSDGVTNLSRTDAKDALAKSKSEEVEKELRRLKAGGMPRAAPSSARSQGSTSSPRSMKHSRHSSTTSLAEAGGDSKTTASLDVARKHSFGLPTRWPASRRRLVFHLHPTHPSIFPNMAGKGRRPDQGRFYRSRQHGHCVAQGDDLRGLVRS